MKKIVVTIILLSCICWGKCTTLCNAFDLRIFDCEPTEYEAQKQGIKRVQITVSSIHINKTAIRSDSSQIILVFKNKKVEEYLIRSDGKLLKKETRKAGSLSNEYMFLQHDYYFGY